MDAVIGEPLVLPVAKAPDREPGALGFLQAARSNAIAMWSERAYDQSVVRGRMLWLRRVLLNAPDSIHHVLIDNAANYRRSPATIRIIRPIIGDGLLLAEGERWRSHRRAIAPALAPRMMPLLARHMAVAAQAGVARLRTLSKDGPVNLLAEMQHLTLEAAGRAMFSVQMQRFGGVIREHLTEYTRDLSRPHALDMMLPPSVPNLRDVARRRFMRRWMGVVEAIIAARASLPAAAADAPRDLFDLLRAAQPSQADLRDNLATLLVAGHETTALALFWALTLLAWAPAEQARVADEVADADLSPEAASNALNQLPFTRAVVDEALRLYPPAFTLIRMAIADDDAAGVPIRRGTAVMIAPWVLHRHHKLWTRPNAFIPDRFSPGAPPPPRFAYLPFGAGPRVCVGAQFALTEATLVLASVIQAFKVAPAGTRVPMPAPIITTQPDHTPGFLLHPR